MATTTRHMKGLPADAVFAVLRDGRSYGDWVVGTRQIRGVEPGWPEPGAAIHYTVGYGPLRKDDATRSVSYAPDRRLELEARAWPAGAVGIVLAVEPTDDGVSVRIDEAPSKGLVRLLHNPLLDLAVKLRNVETLRRLERLARDRHAQASHLS